MSLINEALKRAKEAQKAAPAPTAPRPPLRPTEPTQFARTSPGWMVPAIFFVAAGAGVLGVWHLMSNNTSTKPAQPSAQIVVAATAPPAAERLPVAATPATLPPPAVAATNATPASPSVPAPPTSPTAVVQNDSPTNQAVAPSSPPKPAPLRLQGIVFRLPRPSAMISGKTLFVGDKLGDLRVVAIGQDSATLAGNGETNVLSLPQ